MEKFIVTLSLLFVTHAHAVTPAEQCLSKVGGSWNYGQAPQACAVEPVQKTDVILSQFGPSLLLESQVASGGERTRYMTDMYAILKAMGSYYIRRRDPHVSATEEENFLRALYALATQESVWSHYRRGKDGVVRYMRGDVLHGYGLMQIDDRSHIANIRNGKAQDLIFNMALGLDIFYAQWVRSATQSCVSNAGNWRSRARSAWSAYNGGPGSICRWANPKSAHAQKDIDYRTKYDNKPWLSVVSSTTQESKLNVKCMAEGVRPCNPGSPVELPGEYPDVATVGRVVTIAAVNGINLRTQINGTILLAIPKGTKVKVLVVSVNTTSYEVHYKVSYGGKTGFIYSGRIMPTNTVKAWTTL